MSADGAARAPGLAASLLAVAVVVGASVRMLLDGRHAGIHDEEGYDAAVAAVLDWAPPGQALTLQYRPFCGGCTLEALAGHGLFQVLPPSVATWKLIPLVWTALLAAVVFRAVHRAVGPVGAWATIALLAVPSPTLAELSLVAWGNHLPAAVLGLATLTRATRTDGPLHALATGLLAATALGVGLAAAPLVAVAAALVARRGARPAAAFAGGLAAVLPWWSAVTTATGELPWARLGDPRFFPTPPPPLVRLADLLSPVRLASLLGPLGPAAPSPFGLATTAALAASLPLAARGPTLARALLGALGLWALAYATGPVAFDAGAPHAVGYRYALPLLVLAPVLVGTGVGVLAADGRRAAAAALLLAGLAGGLPDRLAQLAGPLDAEPLRTQEAPDWATFVRVATPRAEIAAAWRCPPSPGTCAALRDHLLAWSGVPGAGPAAAAGTARRLAEARGWTDAPDADLAALAVDVDPAALVEAWRFAGRAHPPWDRAVDDVAWRAFAAVEAADVTVCGQRPAAPSALPGVAAAWEAALDQQTRVRFGAACPVWRVRGHAADPLPWLPSLLAR